MRRWIFRNIEAFLAGLSLVLFAGIIACYVFAIRSVAHSLEQALDADAGSGERSSFDLEAAAKLNLRGLTPNTTNPASQITAPPSPPPAE